MKKSYSSVNVVKNIPMKTTLVECVEFLELYWDIRKRKLAGFYFCRLKDCSNFSEKYNKSGGNNKGKEKVKKIRGSLGYI